MKNRAVLKMLLLFYWIFPTFYLHADALTELKNQVAEQNQKINELQVRLSQYEKDQKKQDEKMEKLVAEIPDKEFGLPETLKWLEKIKIYGDLRFRFEHIDSEANKNNKLAWKQGRSRARIRARIGLNADVTDEWALGVRIATGSDDPVSTNQTLDEGFSSKDIKLDMAFVDWHPECCKGLHVIGGKMKNPFYTVGKNQLIWDGDLTPEGLAGTYQFAFLEGQEIFINGGGFWVEENSSDSEQSLWGIQTGLKQNIGQGIHALGGVSYFDYGNVEGRETIYDSTDGFGNTTDNAGLYVNDYNIVELFAEVGGFKVAGMPLGFYGNFVCNTGADTCENQGWLVGTTLNKAKKPGSWQFGYNYRDLEKDAVIGAFSDSDFIGGGTDGKGHKLNFKLQIAKNVQSAVTFLINDVGDEQKDYQRLQVDLSLKF